MTVSIAAPTAPWPPPTIAGKYPLELKPGDTGDTGTGELEGDPLEDRDITACKIQLICS